MRFAFVLTNLAGGGAEKAVAKLAAALVGCGHEARLVLLEDRIDHALPAGVPVEALGGIASKGWLGKRRLAAKLRARVQALGPQDLIVSSLPFADEVSVLACLPRHVCRIADTLSVDLDRLPPRRAARRLGRYRAMYGSRPLVAVSAGVADDLHRRLGLGGPVTTIPNLFDAGAIRAAATASAALPAQPYVIHVGRLARQKRHDLLLDAWSRIDSGHLLVLLTPPCAALQAMIDARSLARRVVVAGFQANPYPWIAGADLLVLCSDHEGLPNVLIEALLCGTPAVSTDCPSGPREILAAYPECLVPCGDAPALAAAIGRCLAAPPDPARADLAAYRPEAVVAAYARLAETV
ncbi:MAG: glycosyltransferase [Proteobacteria bacterium]|nr:glycosyltransferase [Pseudomonadota bacterium]HQR04146.1 glycosyltransferase [Rhodocyclaceae bacterium]